MTTPGIPAFGVNVDGVAQMLWYGTDFVGSGALITDTHVLTAGHLWMWPGEGVVFEPPSGPVSMVLADSKEHPCYLGPWESDTSIDTGFDIAVCTLSEAAPSDVPRYEVYTKADELNKPSVKPGYGETGWGWTGADTFDGQKRAGLNLYDATAEDAMVLFGGWPIQPGAYLAYDFDSGLPENDAFDYVGLPELGFGDDEVLSGGGDSGGPTFIQDDGGVYKIAGVTSWGVGFEDLPDADPGTNSSFGELGADTRVSSYTDFIESVLTGVPMDGGFKGPYGPGNWWLYDEAGGGADPSETPYRVRMFGGDSSVEGYTEIGTTALWDGIVSFYWNYGTVDDPGWDAFGYFNDDGRYELTSGYPWELFGSASFPVEEGEEFGFWMYTEDGLYGPGIANVYNFEAPVPEPATFALFALGIALMRRRNRAV